MTRNQKIRLIQEAIDLLNEYELKNQIIFNVLQESGINSKTISRMLTEEKMIDNLTGQEWEDIKDVSAINPEKIAAKRARSFPAKDAGVNLAKKDINNNKAVIKALEDWDSSRKLKKAGKIGLGVAGGAAGAAGIYALYKYLKSKEKEEKESK